MQDGWRTPEEAVMAGPAEVGRRSYQTVIGAASLVVAPLVMFVGNLVHPVESEDVAEQARIIAENSTRWFVAHLLLLVGIVLFVPGILCLTRFALSRPRIAYAARVLLLMGVAGLTPVFLAEAVAGRLGGSGAAATEAFLDAVFSGPILAIIAPVGLTFFVGAALFAVPLIKDAGPSRWPASAFLIGVLLVLGEIISSEERLSQIGGLCILAGSVAFARLLLRQGAGRTSGRADRPVVAG